MNYGFCYGFNIASSNECEMKSKESTSFRNKIFNFQKKKKKKENYFSKYVHVSIYCGILDTAMFM